MTDPVEQRFEQTLAHLRARAPEPSDALRARVREVAESRRPAAVSRWRASPNLALGLCAAAVLLVVGTVALVGRGTPDGRERTAAAEKRTPTVARDGPDASPQTRRADENARKPNRPPRQAGSSPDTPPADARAGGRATAPATGGREDAPRGPPPAAPSPRSEPARTAPSTSPPDRPRERPDGARGRRPAPRTQPPLPGAPTPPPTGTPVRSGAADLTVEADGTPDVVAVGETVTYTVTVRNDGPGSAGGVTVTVVLGSQVTFLSATASRGTCERAMTPTCTLGSLATGEEARVTIVGRAAAVGDVSSTAAAHGNGPDPNPGNNSAVVATTIVAGPPEPPVASTATSARSGRGLEVRP